MADEPNQIDIMGAITTRYPDATPQQIRNALEGFIAQSYADGGLPNYSSLTAPTLHKVKTTTVGSFVVCYGMDTGIKREPVVVLIERSEKGPNGEPRYGVLGGYTELGNNHTAGEQPKEGAVRELKEEALDDQGKPIISPSPDRLKILMSGIDYKNPALPTNYNGHSLALEAQELTALKLHADKLENDTDYRAAVTQQSNGEVANVRIMPLAEVVKMPAESFNYPHEFTAIQTLAQELQTQIGPRR